MLFLPSSIKEAVAFINAIDVNKFSRLISRIIQKLHLKVSLLLHCIHSNIRYLTVKHRCYGKIMY